MSWPQMEAPGSAATGQARGYSTAAIEIIGADDAARKAVDGARAVAACEGFGLYELATGGFLLTRAGMARELPDLRAVLTLLRQMESL